MLPYRSVLVTGANGFVGHHLVDALRARLAPDADLHRPSHGDGSSFDLLDAAALREMLAKMKPDLIIHLAAQSSVGQAAGASMQTWRVNVAGTLNLADAIAAESPAAVVAFASSSEVYGTTFNTGAVDESSMLAPLSVYARTKRAAEEVLSDILAPTNRLIVFRPTNHSGPGQDTRFVLPAFADQIAQIEAGRRAPIIHVGSLEAERDFLDVRDVVEAYLRAVEQRPERRQQTFNIASGKLIRISDLLEALLAMTTVPIEVEVDPTRLRSNDVPQAAVNAEKMRSQFGWKPQYELHQTICDVLNDRRRVRLAGRIE